MPETRQFNSWIGLMAAAFFALGACATDPGDVDAGSESSVSTPAEEAPALVYVSLGDSWPEGAHCNGCRTFPQTHADALAEMGRPVTLKDLAGQAQPFFDSLGGGAASLLEAVETDEAFRDAVATGDVIVIATGPNETGQAFDPIQDGTCGGADNLACVHELGRTWAQDFDAILDEIETLRGGRPTAIRLVNAANAFIDPSNSPETARGFAAVFETLTQVLCDSAEAHRVVCVDVRPALNGPHLDQPVDDSSQESMDAVADLLVETGLPELS